MNDFLFVHNWFENKYKTKSSGRYHSFKIALNLFQQLGGKTIIETGTTRLTDDWGAGMSTVIFADYCQRYGGHITTVDIDEYNLNMCKEITQEYRDVITYVLSDSHKYLKEYKGIIDLLYLDSLDFPINENEDCLPPQEHNLKEFQFAEDKLVSHAILLLDDNDFSRGGKSKLTKEYLLTKPEWKCIFEGQQSVWIKI